MRKLLTVCVVSMSLILAQCSTMQIQQIETFIGQVQADAAAVCKFVPTVATIIGLVNSGIGQIVGSVVSAICNAVPPPTSAKFKALPQAHMGLKFGTVGTVGGVPVNGWRV